jgi:hypothetical protein
VAFWRCNIEESFFTDTYFQSCFFKQTVLKKTNFWKAVLIDTSFRNSELPLDPNITRFNSVDKNFCQHMMYIAWKAMQVCTDPEIKAFFESNNDFNKIAEEFETTNLFREIKDAVYPSEIKTTPEKGNSK